jgi:6-pyruvoyltetrahydropterin/6-carboxytetrahydropterin synthase
VTAPAPIVYLTRSEHFSAAHRLWSDQLTEVENQALFGACARPHGHGHNYVLEVTLRGAVDPRTGILVNLTELRNAMRGLIVDEVDHRHLNADATICTGINPTTENLAALFWRILHPCFPDTLYEVKLFETDKNWASYRGEISSARQITGAH